MVDRTTEIAMVASEMIMLFLKELMIGNCSTLESWVM